MEHMFVIDDLRDQSEKLKLKNEILKAENEKVKILHKTEISKLEQNIEVLIEDNQNLNERKLKTGIQKQ